MVGERVVEAARALRAGDESAARFDCEGSRTRQTCCRDPLLPSPLDSRRWVGVDMERTGRDGSSGVFCRLREKVTSLRCNQTSPGYRRSG
jgi:hypothetical protein